MLSRRMVQVFLALVVLQFVSADLYLNNPRGSNNRLNEQTATRANNNRLFDSQNNNRGGYNVGDRTDDAFDQAAYYRAPANNYDPSYTEDGQYNMAFYEGSDLIIQWTNQHGCGGNENDDPHKLNCNFVMQYACDSDDTVTETTLKVNLRNGGNTGTPNDANTYANIPATMKTNDDNYRGRHENEYAYYDCENRDRNMGLFIADRNLNGDAAKYTRQNNNGGRSGLECPEERDYYPYWHPSIWRDIAYLTDFADRDAHCKWIQDNSQNTKELGRCVYDASTVGELNEVNNEAGCVHENAGGETTNYWKTFTHGIAAPDCQPAPWTRSNHLGNGADGNMVNYTWTLPNIDYLKSSKVKMFDGKNDQGTTVQDMYAKCVFRIRYNMTTDDYDGWSTDYKKNDGVNGVKSPVTNDPTVDIGAYSMDDPETYKGLEVALNTNQAGRVFQDRSHVFFIRKRPTAFASKKIHNLNVRGKRGNIVQTFPAMEYDFVPQRLWASNKDLIHIQWTGSNTHDNGGGGGDGQAGDAGQGEDGTDRHNFVQVKSAGDNFPLPLDKYPDALFGTNAPTKCYTLQGAAITDTTTCALILATSGFYRTKASTDESVPSNEQMDYDMNNAPASLIGGIIITDMTPNEEYHYICSRNNSFSNRTQKGSLFISA